MPKKAPPPKSQFSYSKSGVRKGPRFSPTTKAKIAHRTALGKRLTTVAEKANVPEPQKEKKKIFVQEMQDYTEDPTHFYPPIKIGNYNFFYPKTVDISPENVNKMLQGQNPDLREHIYHVSSESGKSHSSSYSAEGVLTNAHHLIRRNHGDVIFIGKQVHNQRSKLLHYEFFGTKGKLNEKDRATFNQDRAKANIAMGERAQNILRARQAKAKAKILEASVLMRRMNARSRPVLGPKRLRRDIHSPSVIRLVSRSRSSTPQQTPSKMSRSRPVSPL